MYNMNLMLVAYITLCKFKYHCFKKLKFINVLLLSKSLRHTLNIQYAIFSFQEMFSICLKHMMILNWRLI